MESIKDKSFPSLVAMIIDDWKWDKVYFGAKPYLSAMMSLSSIEDTYGVDSGDKIVRYFLAYASQWKGPVAREIKAELKRRLK